jgi:hypothetical protein
LIGGSPLDFLVLPDRNRRSAKAKSPAIRP